MIEACSKWSELARRLADDDSVSEQLLQVDTRLPGRSLLRVNGRQRPFTALLAAFCSNGI